MTYTLLHISAYIPSKHAYSDTFARIHTHTHTHTRVTRSHVDSKLAQQSGVTNDVLGIFSVGKHPEGKLVTIVPALKGIERASVKTQVGRSRWACVDGC